MSQVTSSQLLQKGIASAKAGDKVTAHRLLREAIKDEAVRSQEGAWLWLAFAAESAHERLKYLQQALALSPKNKRIYTAIKQVEAQIQMNEHAWHCPICLELADGVQPVCPTCGAILSLENPTALLHNGRIQHDKLQAAIQRLHQMPLNGNAAAVHFNLALAYLNIGQLDEGIAQLEQTVKLRANDTELCHQLELLRRHKAQYSEPQETKATILVVDDSPTICKLLSTTLQRQHYAVIIARDGMEALAKLNEQVPDCVLLDITMPRMDGYQVCKVIKSNEDTKHIPVIMLSGKDGFFDKVRGRMAGSTDYITKPFEPTALVEVLAQHLQK